MLLCVSVLGGISANKNYTDVAELYSVKSNSSRSQNGIKTVNSTITAIEVNSTKQEVVSTSTEGSFSYPDTICGLCNCVKFTIDCTERDIRRPFDLSDWKGLKISKPIDVDLSRNPLIAVSEISELPIRKLNFSQCHIEVIDDVCFVHLKDLSSLDFSYNRLSTFSLSRKVFAGVMVPQQRPQQFLKMRYLSLAYNSIHSLPQDLFAFMTALTHLDLSGNPLTIIDQVTMGAISDLIYLKELKLSNCDLEAIPEGMFRRLPRLERLDVSGNRFTTVPAVLKEAVNLMYLNFDNNLLEFLDKTTPISSLKKLVELHLCYNPELKSIESGALGGLEDLSVLHISNNLKLSKIDASFLVWEDELINKRWPLVKELYIHSNNITEISSKILEGWDHVTRVDFSNNPYICDCNNQWMVDFLTPLVISLAGKRKASKMVCRKPLSLIGTTFVELYKDKTTLECEYAAGLFNAAGPNLYLLFGIVIGIFATFPLVLIVVLLWRRGYFAKYRKHVDDTKWDEDEETDNF
ncbi:unnamed protein product, partial [Iphiclides podalirius]